MSQQSNCAIAVLGIDIGKNSFHVVGHDRRGAIVLRQKWSRGQVEARLANLPPCLIVMEACVGAHHLSRKLQLFGHNARLMPAKYVRPKHLSADARLLLLRSWHQQRSWEDFAMKSLAYATLFALALTPSYGFAQHKMSDEELIKLSLSAAPEAIAKNATVVVMDHDGKMRTLREGTGQWTCMPGHADPTNPDPMCGDKNAMEWGAAWMNHKEPPANKVGFMYMLRGDGGASNTDPYATKEEPGNNWIKTGAHVMIVGSGAKMLDGYPRDAKADPTRPYVMWPGTQYEHLMLPVR